MFTFFACTHWVAIPRTVSPTLFTSAVDTNEHNIIRIMIALNIIIVITIIVVIIITITIKSFRYILIC